MIIVKVYGGLKKILNNTKVHEFANCHNIRHVLKALDVNFKGFHKYLASNALNDFAIVVNNRSNITKENIGLQQLEDGDIVKIIPVSRGSGEDWGSVLSIVVGIVLIYFGWYSPDLFVGFQSFAYGMGASMIMSGVSQLLFKPETIEPSTYESSDPSLSNSYAFSGAVNTTAQGNGIAIGYGRLRVGSQVIGAGIYSV